MSFSQNVQFSGPRAAGEDAYSPPGESLAAEIAGAAKEHGWDADEIDIWRGSGWSVSCRRGAAQAEAALCQFQPGEWMLQVGPMMTGGSFWRRRKPSPQATRDDVFDLAVIVHRVLERSFQRIRWCWDGFPDDEPTTPEPAPWTGEG